MKYLTGVAVNRLEGMSGITILRARRVRLNGASDERIYVQIDGEYAGRLPGHIEIAPDALTLLTPAAYGSKKNNGHG